MADLNENKPGQSAEALAKAGYKKTKVGWIPEEWEYLLVQDLVDSQSLYKPMDGNHGNLHPTSEDFQEKGIPFIMANAVNNGRVEYTKCKFLDKSFSDKLQKGFAKNGDLLLTHKATVGNVAIVKEIPWEYIMLSPQVTYYRVKDAAFLHIEYLKSYFESDSFQKVLEVLSGGGTRSYIGITKQRKLPVLLPPLPEQRGIARILSTWDAAIDKLGQLITKKQALKKGLMQQLLSGRVRFPEFVPPGGTRYKETKVGVVPEDWEVVRLGDITSSRRLGGNYSNSTRKTLYPLIKMGNVGRGKIKLDKIEYIDQDNSIDHEDLLSYGDLLLNTRNTLDLVGKVAIWKNELSIAAYNSNLMKLEFDSSLIASNFFANYFLNSHVALKQLKAFATGTTSVAAIYTRDLLRLKFIVPPQGEQLRIQSALLDIDNEIEKLEIEKGLLETQKKGLMQQLLTGAVRVKN